MEGFHDAQERIRGNHELEEVRYEFATKSASKFMKVEWVCGSLQTRLPSVEPPFLVPDSSNLNGSAFPFFVMRQLVLFGCRGIC